MSNTIRIRTVQLLLLLTFSFSGVVLAAKVVVVPLGGDSNPTLVASDTRTSGSSSVNLTESNEVALTTSITATTPVTIIAIASVEVSSDGGDNDNVNCNLNIDGSDGVRQSSHVNSGLGSTITLPLTQVRSVSAGTTTIFVECNEGGTSNSTLRDRTLSVIAVP